MLPSTTSLFARYGDGRRSSCGTLYLVTAGRTCFVGNLLVAWQT